MKQEKLIGLRDLGIDPDTLDPYGPLYTPCYNCGKEMTITQTPGGPILWMVGGCCSLKCNTEYLKAEVEKVEAWIERKGLEGGCANCDVLMPSADSSYDLGTKKEENEI